MPFVKNDFPGIHGRFVCIFSRSSVSKYVQISCGQRNIFSRLNCRIFALCEYTSNKLWCHQYDPSLQIGIPNSSLNFEVGYKDYGNNSYEDQWFFNLTFNLSKINPNTSLVSDEAFERVSMKEKKYEKVRRENLIVKSKSFSVKAGGF